jgi:hypothetical protein
VASQIVVGHEHLASVTAVVLLFSYLGNATGESIAGGMWTSTLKKMKIQSGANCVFNQAVYLAFLLKASQNSQHKKLQISLAASQICRHTEPLNGLTSQSLISQ